jgi:hypothetical protein
MKIVGFEANGGIASRRGRGRSGRSICRRSTKSIPSDLGECLRRSNGDLSALKDAAKRAPPPPTARSKA